MKHESRTYFKMYCTFQASEDDVSQFDTKFTGQTPIDSPVESTLSESANLIFQVNFIAFSENISPIAPLSSL